MASLLNPYLSFDGTCREAMEFYRSVLGGELEVHTFGDIAPAGLPEAGDAADKIMHSSLQTDAGYTIFASDLAPGMPAPTGAGMTISISGDEVDRLRGYWAGLAEGGEISVPLERQMWGDEFGMLTDRHGTPWMVNILGSALPAE